MVVEITPIGIQTLHWQFYIVWTVLNASFVPLTFFIYPEVRNCRESTLSTASLILTLHRPQAEVSKISTTTTEPTHLCWSSETRQSHPASALNTLFRSSRTRSADKAASTQQHSAGRAELRLSLRGPLVMRERLNMVGRRSLLRRPREGGGQVKDNSGRKCFEMAEIHLGLARLLGRSIVRQPMAWGHSFFHLEK